MQNSFPDTFEIATFLDILSSLTFIFRYVVYRLQLTYINSFEINKYIYIYNHNILMISLKICNMWALNLKDISPYFVE